MGLSPTHLVRRLIARFSITRLAAQTVYRVQSPPLKGDESTSAFSGIDSGRVLADLSRDGLSLGFSLPPPLLARILQYAKDMPCTGGFGDRELAKHQFTYSEVRAVEERIRRSIPIAHYPHAGTKCPAIVDLLNDPKVRNIASAFLGAEPMEAVAMLWWSFVTSMSEKERLAGAQTVKFHFDEFALKFVYFSFYLTPVDEKSGPHVCVLGSHKEKSLLQKIGKATRSDDEIFQQYGRDRVKTILGPSGFGFVEDSFCFHKATVPTGNDRLFLQLRFGLGVHGHYI